MVETFLISDTHFSHANIIKHCNRPFYSYQEQDETIVKNWNSVVKKNDTIYHLGDISFRDYNILKRLNGFIIVIKGNHDRIKELAYAKNEGLIGGFYETKGFLYNNNFIFLSHFPHLRWDRCFHGSYHFFGHEHGTLKQVFGRSMDVSVDCINFTPIHIDDCILKLENRTNTQFYEV